MSTVIKVTAAQERKIIAREGDDFSLVMAVKNPDTTDFDFTDYTAKMQVKSREVETDTAVLSFETGTDIALTSGQIAISKPASEMLGKSGKYFYDLKITDPQGGVSTWLYGSFELLPTITV
jgi:hypothetical protein